MPLHTVLTAGSDHTTLLLDTSNWRGILLSCREGSHGLGPVVEKVGSVMGSLSEAEGEPTTYWAEDAVLYPTVEEAIRTDRPDLIVIHPCGARWDGYPIVMDIGQTVAMCEVSPRPVVVATHMGVLDHATVDRDELRWASLARGIAPERLRIPHDDEVPEFVASQHPAGRHH